MPIIKSSPTTKAMWFDAQMTSQANFTTIRWYSGAFKNISLGTIRAVYRAVAMISQNRNLV